MKQIRLLSMMAMVLWASALSAQSHWQCDYAKFSESMAIYFQMADGDNAIADVTPYEVAAFVGEECRGVATFHEEMINEKTVKYGYLRIYSNAESAEKIILKVYNKSTQLEKRIAISSFPFEKDKRIGVPSEPVKYDITANVPQYQLTVTPQDAEMGTAEGSGTFEEDEIVHIKATANTGYHFVKWSDEDTDEERTIVITQKTDLVAVFAPNQHLLTFISEGDTVRSALQDYNSTIVPPETPQKEGYSFVKWMPNLAEKMPNNPLTYEATFKINEYTMTFMVDGKAVREAVLEYGKPVPVPQSPSKTAYTFAGWDPVVPATVPGSHMTFTAQWTPITYSISYDLAGGQLAEGETNPASYTIESAAITLKTPTREGYTFAGWTGTDLGAAAMSVTIATGKYGERTYTATWTPITYNLTYDLASGALPEGKTNPVTYTIETEDITLVNPERTAYTFAGWTGTGLDQATAEVKIAKGSTGDRSYAATWSPVTYTITYDLAGGQLAEGETNPASYTIESEAITLKTPTREGYTFAGWTGTGIESSPIEVTIAAGSTGVRSYTATWTPITYNLTYDLVNGALPEGKTNPATYTIETEDITLINPERTGYTFAGWTGSGLDQATTEVKIAKGNTGDRSYTATWTPISYTITYDLAGGVLAEGDTNPASYTIESVAITLKTPTREGYTFAGWTGTGIEGTSMAVTIAAGSTGVRRYTATWTPITYNLTYELANGVLPEGKTNPATYTIETEDISLINPERTGYEFAGWTGTGLDKATMEVKIAKGSIGDRTYTATWTVKQYTITFKLENGEDDIVYTQNYGTAIVVPDGLTKEGYNFTGWDSEVPATVPAMDKTFTAQWEAIEYKIEYSLVGGTFNGEYPTTYTVETPDFSLVNPTREGYDFIGWIGEGLTEPTKTVTIAKGSKTGNLMYTAQWAEKPAVMLGDVNGDGKIDTVDLSLLINKILGIEDPRFINEAGDLNHDGNYDTVDLALLINLILNQ